MSFEEFEHQARLYVIGALDSDETRIFSEARQRFGERADSYIRECDKLGAALSLSLAPRSPAPDAKERLFSRIQQAIGGRSVTGDG